MTVDTLLEMAAGGELVTKPGTKPGTKRAYSNVGYVMLGQDGLCATAGDLVRWTHALHNGHVLLPASYQAMITPRGAAVASNYGFGLSVNPAAWGQKAIFHGGGSLTGSIAEVHWYPEPSVATALLYNVFPRVPGVSDAIPRVVSACRSQGRRLRANPPHPRLLQRRRRRRTGRS